MAEPAGKDLAPGLALHSLPTPSSPYTPTPLTPTSTRPRLGPRRQSRFTEDMTGGTLAASVSERSLDNYWYGPSAEDINTNTNNTNTFSTPAPTPAPAETSGDRVTWMRFVNGALHAVPCLVLLGIVGYAMRVLSKDMGGYMSILAVILICVLSADVVLDVLTVFRAQKPWPTWGLVLRFIYGFIYITLFLVYVGLGSAFPEGYTYWGLPPNMVAPVVYILLCVEALWNLLHLPICRYHLGTIFLHPTTPTTTTTTISPLSKPPHTATTTHNNPRTTVFNPRLSATPTETSSLALSLTWRRWIRTRSSTTHHHLSHEDLENNNTSKDSNDSGFFHQRGVRPSSAEVTLREQPREEEEEEEDGASSRGASSYGGKDLKDVGQ